MKNLKLTTFGLIFAALVIVVAGCGNGNKDDRLDAGGDLIDETGRATVSEALLSVKELTDEVNQFVAGSFGGITNAAEIETAMTGFAEEYAELAADIDNDDITEADELALTFAREGEAKTTALGSVLAATAGTIDYSDASVIGWGEYSDKVDASVADDPSLSDSDYVNYKGIGKGQGKGEGQTYGKGKGLDKGYGWWKEDFASDDEQYRNRHQEREREQYHEEECEGTLEYDGSGKGRGSGSGKGGGGGKGKGR